MGSDVIDDALNAMWNGITLMFSMAVEMGSLFLGGMMIAAKEMLSGILKGGKFK